MSDLTKEQLNSLSTSALIQELINELERTHKELFDSCQNRDILQQAFIEINVVIRDITEMCQRVLGDYGVQKKEEKEG